MKTKDLVNLLNRAAAALETPKDLNQQEFQDVIDDLTFYANQIAENYELIQP